VIAGCAVHPAAAAAQFFTGRLAATVPPVKSQNRPARPVFHQRRQRMPLAQVEEDEAGSASHDRP